MHVESVFQRDRWWTLQIAELKPHKFEAINNNLKEHYEKNSRIEKKANKILEIKNF